MEKKLSWFDKNVTPLDKEYKDYISKMENTSPEEWFEDGERNFTEKEKKFEAIYEFKNNKKFKMEIKQNENKVFGIVTFNNLGTKTKTNDFSSVSETVKALNNLDFSDGKSFLLEDHKSSSLNRVIDNSVDKELLISDFYANEISKRTDLSSGLSLNQIDEKQAQHYRNYEVEFKKLDADEKVQNASYLNHDEINLLVPEERRGYNFHIKVSKEEAEYLIANDIYPEIMNKEYGDDPDYWTGMNKDDFDEETNSFDAEYQTFEINVTPITKTNLLSLLNEIETFKIEKELSDFYLDYELDEHLIPAVNLPDGWEWKNYDDGSGQLKSPTGNSYYSYDLQTQEYKLPNEGKDWTSMKDYLDSPKDLNDFINYAEKDLLEKSTANRLSPKLSKEEQSHLVNFRMKTEIIGGKIKDIAAEAIQNPEYLKQFDQNTQNTINQFIKSQKMENIMNKTDSYKKLIDPDSNSLTAFGKDSDFIDNLFEDIENGVGDMWKKEEKASDFFQKNDHTEIVGGKIEDIAAEAILNPDSLKQYDQNTQNVINLYNKNPKIMENNQESKVQNQELKYNVALQIIGEQHISPLIFKDKNEAEIKEIIKQFPLDSNNNEPVELLVTKGGESLYGENSISLFKTPINKSDLKKTIQLFERQFECAEIEIYTELGQRSIESNVIDYGLEPLSKKEETELAILHKKLNNVNNIEANFNINKQNPKIMENNQENEVQKPKKWSINPSKESEFHVKDLHSILDLQNKGAVYNFIKRNFGPESAEELRKTDFKYPAADSPTFQKMKEKSAEIETLKPQLFFFEKDMKTQEWRDVLQNYNFTELNKDGKVTLAHVDYLMENLPKQDMLNILEEFKVHENISNTFREVFENGNIEDTLNFPLAESKLETQFKEERYHLVNSINLNDVNKEVFISVGNEYLESAKQKSNDQELNK